MEKWKIKRNRGVKKGFDYKKIAKIWTVLAEAGDWLHVAEISKRSKIHEATVRWYLDKFFQPAIEETRIIPTIRLRMVKLKGNMDLKGLIQANEVINSIKNHST